MFDASEKENLIAEIRLFHKMIDYTNKNIEELKTYAKEKSVLDIKIHQDFAVFKSDVEKEISALKEINKKRSRIEKNNEDRLVSLIESSNELIKTEFIGEINLVKKEIQVLIQQQNDREEEHEKQRTEYFQKMQLKWMIVAIIVSLLIGIPGFVALIK